MSQRINARSFDGNNNINIQIDFPDMCPICNHWIVPIYVSSIYETNNGITYLQLNFLCSRRDCYNMFISYYKKYDWWNASFIESKPKNFSWKNFWWDILMLKDKIPTKFFEIYNEAEQAEQLWLFTICWWWYRKALEFLIKDYAIHLNESERDKIEWPKYTLSQCIKDYMPSKTTKTFSTLSTRLWNDEVHYTKQHDKDIRYMKTTISALLSTIHNEILEKEAEELINPTLSN